METRTSNEPLAATRAPDLVTVATSTETAPGRNPFGEVKLKYFGRELPPRCELHKCYLTDDGEHFYCTNMACNKHKYRRTKHTKYSRYEHLDTAKGHGTAPPRVKVAKGPTPDHGIWPLVHFRCPDCRSRDIDMRILDNKYVCKSCTYEWK